MNHQYSKSFEFEQAFSRLLEQHVVEGVRYFSLLRPLSEVAIARRFARHPGLSPGLPQLQHRVPPGAWSGGAATGAATVRSAGSSSLRWRRSCERQRLIETFGRNLLDDAAQIDGFAELCGLQRHKPFECVGEIEESAAVMAHLANHGGLAR